MEQEKEAVAVAETQNTEVVAAVAVEDAEAVAANPSFRN